MKEFTTDIKDHLIEGLRREAAMTRGVPALAEARGFEIRGSGLSPIREVFDAPIGLAYSHPYPQIFEGTERLYAATADAIYSLDEFSPELIISGLAAGGRWHLCSLGPAYIFTNGTAIVYRSGYSGFLPGTLPPGAQVETRSLSSVCHHRGRIFCGGFDDAMWSGAMTSRLNSWEAALEERFDFPLAGIGGRTVLWSSIGGGDFPFWLFSTYPAIEMWDNSKDKILERLARNEWGFMHLPDRGDVLQVLALGDSVIVGTETAVWRMRMSGFTYGLEKLSSVGLFNRDSMAGDDMMVACLLANGELFVATPGEYRRLGYSEHLENILLDDPVVSFDSFYRRWFFCNADFGYVLSQDDNQRFVLTESDFVVSGIVQDGGTVWGTKDVVSTDRLVVSNPLDMSLRARKTVTAVQVSGEVTDGIFEVALDYSYDNKVTWSRTPFTTCNAEGTASMRITATDFRIVVRTAQSATASIDNVWIKYQVPDKRYIRGPYVDV